jgi:hypothetical protein
MKMKEYQRKMQQTWMNWNWTRRSGTRSTRQLPNRNTELALPKNMSKIGRTKPTQGCTNAARQNHKERVVEMNATTANIAGTCTHMKKEEDKATNERQSKQA